MAIQTTVTPVRRPFVTRSQGVQHRSNEPPPLSSDQMRLQRYLQRSPHFVDLRGYGQEVS